MLNDGAVAKVQAAASEEYLARLAFVSSCTATYGAVDSALGSKALAEPFFRRFRAEARGTAEPAETLDPAEPAEPSEPVTP